MKTLKWHEYSSVFFNFGLVASLLFINLIINVVQPIRNDSGVSFEDDDIKPYLNIKEIFLSEPERSLPRRKKPKIKEQTIVFEPTTIETPKEKVEPIISVEEGPLIANQTKSQEAIPSQKTAPEEDNKVYVSVQNMPYIKNCETLTETERRLCTQKSILDFIQKNLKYPPLARENGIEGTVVISFIVNKNGKIEDLTVLRDIGAGCGQAVEKVFNHQLEWHPGYQNGRAVSVKYTVPVRFKML